MRIVVISPPRSGNHWIECLLGEIYGLEHLGGAQKPPDTKARAFHDWAKAGGFPDDSIFHLHCRFRGRLCDVIDAVPAHIVTMLRDPYDAFVSRYFWTQKRQPMDIEKAERRSRHQMVGKPLDDPAVLAFLEDSEGFEGHLRSAIEWSKSGRAAVVRYEDLHTRPVETLTEVTNAISPVEGSIIAAAIEACRADNMRQQSEKMQWNVRVAKVGDSREKLGPAHLEIFRDRYADLIQELGYEVRDVE